MTLQLAGTRVCLRAFRKDEFDTVWNEETRDLGEHQEAFPANAAGRQQMFERLRASGSWTRDELRLAVEAEDALVGDVQARISGWVLPAGVTEVGINLFAGKRGRGYGTEALQLLARHLFDEDQYQRVQLSTDLANVAMRRCAEKAGFAFEGVLRGYWRMPDGSARDYAMYAVTRNDHERSKDDPWTPAS